jgi:hypothetical protein
VTRDVIDVPVAEKRRALALSLAIEAAWMSGAAADIVAAAKTFELFLLGSNHDPVVPNAPADGLMEQLRAVKEGMVVHDPDEHTDYLESGTHARLDVTGAIRAAEAAGLVIRQGGTTRWLLTARGRETINRGQV